MSVRAKTVLIPISAALYGVVSAATPAAAHEPRGVVAQTTVENVHIPSQDGVVLAATLRVPRGAGRYPVVILQTGSGRSQRGAFGSLQHRLQDAGIASIDFDKRGVGQSTGTFTDTMEDMEADLAATIAWLRKRSDIDGSRIALLGHSQGAAAVPIVAERDGHLAAIVFLAGPVGERGTMFLQGMRAQLIEGGHAAALADRIVAATRVWMEARNRAAPADEIAQARAAVVVEFTKAGFNTEQAEGATKVLDNPQLLSMYNVGPGSALAKLHIPILAVFGGRDEIVGAQTSAAAAALGENPQALVVQVPGAGHLFSYRPANAPPRANPAGDRWLSLLPEALITDWLKEWLVGGS